MTRKTSIAVVITIAFIALCAFVAYMKKEEPVKARLEIEVHDGRLNRTYYTNTFKFSDPMIIFTDIYGVTRSVPIYSVIEIEDR